MEHAAKPRKIAVQERAKATVEAILDAAAHILIARGYAGVTTNAVAVRAGVSIGSLYQYFPNKAAVLAALHTRHRQRMCHAVEKAMRESLSSTDAVSIRRLAQALVAAHLLDPELEARFAALPQEAALSACPEDMETDGRNELHALLRENSHRYGMKDPALAASILYAAVRGILHGFVGPASPCGPEAVVDEITRVIQGYLDAGRAEQ